VVLVGATVCGIEVAARLAQRLGTGCLGECLDLRVEDGALIARRRVLGRFVATQRLAPSDSASPSSPLLATIPPRRWEAPPPGSSGGGEVETLSVELPQPRVKRVESRARDEDRVDLEGAEVVVGAGRGLARAEDLVLVEELARVLGGVVGATRPLTDDLGWLPASSKIGLSGRTVKPRLYIACGISGQIEHLVGIREAEVVVAINRDPDAPIFQAADYLLVDDLYELVPALTRALGELLGSGGPRPAV
jgi:electron transfer flavoprotein alpha subunit